MSTNAEGTALKVNTIGLIVGISVTATVLGILLIVGVALWCRKAARRSKRSKSRTRLYMVPENAGSPFSSINEPPSGGFHSYNAGGYDNSGLDVGEFRPNPLAESPFYPQPGVGYADIQHNSYNNDMRQYGGGQRLTQSTQSLSHESQSLYHSLYSKLVDTIHTHTGRPLYLCKREDYRGRLTDHFDIIGKTRMGDWLVRPKANVPNRPKRPSKKPKAPRSSNSQNSKTSGNNERLNGFSTRPGGASGGMITTPFGAAERMPRYFFSGSNLSRSNSNAEPHYSSLPRVSDLRNQPSHGKSKPVKRQSSMGAGDKQSNLDQNVYAKVMQKNALNGNVSNPNNIPTRQNPNRRPISVIEESPKLEAKATPAGKTDTSGGQHRERSGSASTLKSLGAGITDQFKFLEQYDTEEERF